jgi:hypothetical protein
MLAGGFGWRELRYRSPVASAPSSAFTGLRMMT